MSRNLSTGKLKGWEKGQERSQQLNSIRIMDIPADKIKIGRIAK